MMLSDFLSRQKYDKSDLHAIIPLPFNMQQVLHAKYHNIHETKQKRYFVQTRPQAKISWTV